MTRPGSPARAGALSASASSTVTPSGAAARAWARPAWSVSSTRRVEIGDEVAEPGGGLAGIERRVELAGLQDAQERHDEGDAGLEHQRHGCGAGAEAVEERVRHLVGGGVQLGVAQRAAGRLDGEAVGMRPRHLREARGDRLLDLGRGERHEAPRSGAGVRSRAFACTHDAAMMSRRGARRQVLRNSLRRPEAPRRLGQPGALRTAYFMLSIPAWAIWASCWDVTPETPTPPMILPSATIGMPPSSTL